MRSPIGATNSGRRSNLRARTMSGPALPPDRSETTASCHGVHLGRCPDLIPDEVWRTIREGRYEAAELRAALGSVRAGDRLLDIGAGLGILGAALAKHTGVGRILSVEADPRLIPHIERLHAGNGIGNIAVLNCALTAAPENGAAFYRRRDFRRSSLDPRTGPYAAKVRVPTRTFDSVLSEFRPTIRLSDIEGGEAALFGTPREFREVRAIVMELHLRNYPEPALAAVDRIFGALGASGFAYDPLLSAGEVVTFRRIRVP